MVIGWLGCAVLTICHICLCISRNPPYFAIYFKMYIIALQSISCSESHAINKAPTSDMAGEGQAKLVLSGGESHTAWLGKGVAMEAKSSCQKCLFFWLIPYSTHALLSRIFCKCNGFQLKNCNIALHLWSSSLLQIIHS